MNYDKPLNIITVKIGQKYTANDVNRVFYSALKYVMRPFKFFCYTEDMTGVDPSIIQIPYVDIEADPIVYNKLYILGNHCNHLTGDNMYLDVDTLITGDITPILDSMRPGKLAVVKCYWRPMSEWKLDRSSEYEYKHFDEYYSRVIYPHDINSSIMMWVGGDPVVNSIWDHYKESQEAIACRYYLGMDYYLYAEHRNKLAYTPRGVVGSFLFGTDFDFEKDDIIFNFDDTRIILFNGKFDKERVYLRYTKHFTPPEYHHTYLPTYQHGE